MQNKSPAPPPVTSPGTDFCESVGPFFASTPHRRQDSIVLELPPGRDGVTADIRTINRQCFLMLCNTHRGLLSSLVPVPARLVLAARNLVKPGASEDWSCLWTKTLVHYTECLVDARGQVSAAAKLHGLGDCGRKAKEAIEAIETAMPIFLGAASRPSDSHVDLQKSAEQLARSSMALTESLSGLLQAVETALERAKQIKPSEQF